MASPGLRRHWSDRPGKLCSLFHVGTLQIQPGLDNQAGESAPLSSIVGLTRTGQALRCQAGEGVPHSSMTGLPRARQALSSMAGLPKAGQAQGLHAVEVMLPCSMAKLHMAREALSSMAGLPRKGQALECRPGKVCPHFLQMVSTKAGQALERALPSFYMAGLCRHGQALGSQSRAAVPSLPLVSSADHSSPGEPGHGTGATFFHGWPPWDGQTLGKQTREAASPSSMAGLCLLFHSWLFHVLLGPGV